MTHTQLTKKERRLLGDLVLKALPNTDLTERTKLLSTIRVQERQIVSLSSKIQKLISLIDRYQDEIKKMGNQN